MPVTWDVVPNGRDAIERHHLHQEQTVFRTVVYRAYTRNWRRPLPNRAHVVADNDGIPGPLIKAQVGDEIRVHFKNLDTEFKRPHSMHFHGVRYAPGSRRRVHPRLQRPRRQRQARPVVHVPPLRRPAERPASGRTTTTARPCTTSIEGGLYGMLSIRGKRRGAAGPRVRRGLRAITRLRDDQRPRLRRQHADLPGEGRRDSCSGTSWRSATSSTRSTSHGHRWVNPDGTPEDTRTIGPAESFRVRWGEDAAGHVALPLPRRGPHGDRA